MRTRHVLTLILLLLAGMAAVVGGTLGILETRAFLADAISAQGIALLAVTNLFR